MSEVPEEPRAVALWWDRLAEALLDAGRRIGVLAEEVERDWPDGRGRDWAERTAQVRAELGREALAAAELAADHARRIAEGPDVAARRPGVRLGGTDADRADAERGVRIAELPGP